MTHTIVDELREAKESVEVYKGIVDSYKMAIRAVKADAVRMADIVNMTAEGGLQEEAAMIIDAYRVKV